MKDSSFFSNQLTGGELPDNLILSLGFLLNKSAQKIKDQGDRYLEQYNITTQHLGILLYLTENNKSSQIEIATSLMIDRTTMVKLIDDLENEEYVKRVKDPNDRRRYQIKITKVGKHHLPIFSDLMKAVEKKFMAPLSAEEASELLDILRKLVELRE